MPRVSAVVGAFNRPGRLRTFSRVLVDQTFTDWEAVVVDNSDQPEAIAASREMCKIDPRIRYEEMGIAAVHLSRHSLALRCFGVDRDDHGRMDLGAERRHLCLPLVLAEMDGNRGCDTGGVCLLRLRHREGQTFPTSRLRHYAEACQIDKTCYIIRRDKFPIPWPGKIGSRRSCGILVNELVAKGIKLAKLQQIMCINRRGREPSFNSRSQLS